MAKAQLKVFREISAIIERTGDYHDGLQQVLAAVLTHVKADAAALLVGQEGDDALTLLAATGRVVPGLSPAFRVPIASSLAGRCFREHASRFTIPALAHAAFDFRDLSWTESTGALLHVPLVVAGRCLGVLVLTRHRARPFAHTGIHFVEAVAAPFSVYVLNARLARQQSDLHELTATACTTGPRLVKGKAVTQGVVHGRALLIKERDLFDAIPVEYASGPEAEQALLQQALALARQDTVNLQKEAAQVLTEADVSIFYAHLLLLEDPLLLSRIQEALARGFTLRFALKTVADSFAADLQKVDSDLVRERLADIKDVLLRIARAAAQLTDHPRPAPTAAPAEPPPKEKVIVVARELLPSQLIRLPLKNLAGIICEEGGATTHLSILAKALNLPTLVGVPQATLTVRMNDEIILDTSTGCAYIRPSQDIVAKFEHALRHHSTPGKHAPCKPESGFTSDGTAIRLGGNISLISELPLLERYGAMGIGLYRTEFMFMVRAAYPSEDEQYQVFRRVAEAGGEFSSTIRILDVGGDKPLPYVDFGQEPNPFLGWRGLRFLLANPHYLEPHLRAVLRATAHGRVNILLPMVADLEELLEAKAVLASCRRAVEKSGVVLPSACQLGIMLEVPSAVWHLPAMLPHLDFVSIGTNDLTQYTFAVDRGNAKVARWFRPLHPVILLMVRQICQLCDAAGKTVSLCGELGGTPAAVPLLVGAGVRFLSMNPWQMPAVRAVLTQASLPACQTLLAKAVTCTTAAEVEKLAAEFATGGADGKRKGQG